MADMQRIPLILAAVIIVVRILLEENGAGSGVTFILGVSWLHLLVPIYFALQITGDHPYKGLFKQVLIYSIFTRLMVMVTYMLAYQFNWSATRFGVAGGGGVGADSALSGLVLAPLTNLAFWIIAAVVVGMITGSITLAIRRR
ncbi:MAG: hypothetical protein V3T83_14485 [Acidobacteriota bacterium]